MCCFSIIAHIIWKEVWSSRKKKKPTNMDIFLLKKYIMCKNDKYFEQNSPRFSCKETIRERGSKDEDDRDHCHSQRRPRHQGVPAWRRKWYCIHGLQVLLFYALWMMTFPLQCAVSLLKAEIYRITSIPPENQRIKFEVNVLAGSLKTLFYPLCRGLSCTRTGQGCPRWGSPTAPPSTLPSTPLTRCCICTNIWHSAVWEILTFQGSYREI